MRFSIAILLGLVITTPGLAQPVSQAELCNMEGDLLRREAAVRSLIVTHTRSANPLQSDELQKNWSAVLNENRKDRFNFFAAKTSIVTRQAPYGSNGSMTAVFAYGERNFENVTGKILKFDSKYEYRSPGYNMDHYHRYDLTIQIDCPFAMTFVTVVGEAAPDLAIEHFKIPYAFTNVNSVGGSLSKITTGTTVTLSGIIQLFYSKIPPDFVSIQEACQGRPMPVCVGIPSESPQLEYTNFNRNLTVVYKVNITSIR